MMYQKFGIQRQENDAMTSTIFGHTEIILEENRKAKDLKPASGWKMRMETH